VSAHKASWETRCHTHTHTHIHTHIRTHTSLVDGCVDGLGQPYSGNEQALWQLNFIIKCDSFDSTLLT